MHEDTVKIIEKEFKGEDKGDALFIDIGKLKKDYSYIGLWYARDRTEFNSITTEFFYTVSPELPGEFTEELKENSFKQVNRYRFRTGDAFCWTATRIDNSTYCRMKLFGFQKEHLYLNCQVINNRPAGVELLGKGVLRGGAAHFVKLGIEDMTGEIDFNDTIMYLVLLTDLPPADWGVDDKSYGVQRLPVFVPAVKFTADKKYTTWNGQNPLDI